MSEALLALRPGARFSVNADDSEQIIFHDKTVPPSESEIRAAIDSLAPAAPDPRAHPALQDGAGPVTRDEINALKAYLRGE